MPHCPTCDREIEGAFCPFDGTPLAHVGIQAVLPESGDEIEGRYELHEELGRGGMAVVFRALNLTLGHDVALKVLRPRWASDRRTVARFAREARATSQIDHVNVVKVYDFGWAEQGYYFLAMELLEGRPLRAEIEGTRVSPPRALALLVQIADGMARAHEMGVIHRDLKPENVMVHRKRGRDHVTIVDFGLSKLAEGQEMVTREGDVIGTPDYMAPEQWKGTGVDARADVYAFGVMAYELFAGELPFKGDTIVQKLSAHLSVEPFDLARHPGARGIPDGLAPIVMKCLAKDTLDRYPHMGRVKAMLEPIADAYVKERRADEGRRSTMPAPAATVLAPIEEASLDRRELLEEIARLRRVRQHRLTEITPNVYGGDPPPNVRAMIAAIEASEAAADALGEEAALADASLEEARRARRQKEAELRAGLIEANLQLAVLRSALPGNVTAPGTAAETMEMVSAEVLLDEPVEDVDSARRALARAEKRLAGFAGARDEAIEEAERRLAEANAASAAAEAALAKHYETLERALYSVSPTQVMELSELDRALVRYRGRLEDLDRGA